MLLKLFEGGLFISYYPESLVDLVCLNKMRNHRLQMGLVFFYVITHYHTLKFVCPYIFQHDDEALVTNGSGLDISGVHWG